MAARAIWKGDLSVGLVTVPVAAYVATDDGPSTSTSWLHGACQHPISQKKTCPTCAVADIPMTDIVNGVKQSDGSYVVVTKEELAAIKVRSSSTIVVEAFVPATEVDPLYVATTYYLGPGKATPGFALLREAMAAKGVMLTGRIAMNGRERRVAIRPLGTLMALQLLHTQAEIRATAQLPFVEATAVPVDPQQLALMQQLVGIYAGQFEASSYDDQYVQAFQALVEAKRTGAVMPTAVAETPAPVVDFMEALKASLAAHTPPAVATPVPEPVPVRAKLKAVPKKKTAAA